MSEVPCERQMEVAGTSPGFHTEIPSTKTPEVEAAVWGVYSLKKKRSQCLVCACPCPCLVFTVAVDIWGEVTAHASSPLC